MSTEIPGGEHKKPPIPTPAKRVPALNIEKRNDRLYPVDTLHKWFAISSLLLFVFSVVMILADYSRQWKVYQRQYTKLSLERAAEDRGLALSAVDRTKYQAAVDAYNQGRSEVKQHAADIERIQAKLDDLNAEYYKVNTLGFQFEKALYETEKYTYDEAVARKSPDVDQLQSKLQGIETRMNDFKAKAEQLTLDIRAAKEELAVFIGKRDDALKQAQTLLSDYTDVQTRIKNLNPGDIVTSFRNAPVIDMLNASERVQQILLPNIPKEQPFGSALRADRCITCHLGIDKKANVDDPQPFKTHPRMDLFLASASAHPVEQFGCTSCHSGLDRATDFQTAGHTPRDEEQKKVWEKKYGWHPDHFLETPMYSMKNVEAGCYKCHSGSTEVPQAAALDNGRDLIRIYGCFGCHKLPGFENLRKVGPDLSTVSGKLTKDWVRKWLADPKGFKPEARMPKFWYNTNNSGPAFDKRNQAEINAITEYLWAKSKPKALPSGRSGGNAARGKEIVEQVGCFGCHAVGAIPDPPKDSPKQTMTRRRHGYSLENQGSKVGAEWIYNWVKDPKSVWAETKMPSLRLSDDEAADVTAYLVSMKNPEWEKKTPPSVETAALDEVMLELLRAGSTDIEAREKLKKMSFEEKNLEAGKRLVQRYGCFGCHVIPGMETMQPIGTELTEAGSKLIAQFDFGFQKVEHTRANWYTEKLKDPRIFDKERVKRPDELLKMPNFGFSDSQVEAITMVLTSMVKDRVPMDMRDRTADAISAGRQLISEKNCRGCHIIEGMGGDIRVFLRAQKKDDMYPPNLNTQGAKTQPTFLRAFLDDPGKTRLRPWLESRMPTFHFTEEENGIIGKYFSALDKADFPYISTGVSTTPERLAAGAELFSKFNCLSCHINGSIRPPGKGPADLAPDLALAGQRLRAEWISSLWLPDPQKVTPGTKMPQFWAPSRTHPEGTTPFPTILGGDVNAQIQAVRDHVFMTVGGGRRRTN